MNIGNVSRPSQQTAGPPAVDSRVQSASGSGPQPASSEVASAQTRPDMRAAPREETARIAAAEQPPELSRASVEKLVERISQQIRIERRSLSFTINDELGKTIVKVIDRETEEVIRQIPSEELMRFAEAIHAMNEQHTSDTEAATGLFIQEQA